MDRTQRLGAWAWIITLQFFLVQAIVQAAWTTPFSLADSMISDLARETCGPLHRSESITSACSPLHALMNLSIALNGFLIVIGYRSLRARWPATHLVGLGLAMVALTAPGHLMVGLFPSDTALRRHMLGAGSILVLANPAMLVTGFGAWHARRRQAAISLLLGAIGLLGTIGFLWSIDPLIGHGGYERLAFYPLTIWFGVMGILELAGARGSPSRSRRQAGLGRSAP
jgi:hypothetical membrane protein